MPKPYFVRGGLFGSIFFVLIAIAVGVVVSEIAKQEHEKRSVLCAGAPVALRQGAPSTSLRKAAPKPLRSAEPAQPLASGAPEKSLSSASAQPLVSASAQSLASAAPMEIVPIDDVPLQSKWERQQALFEKNKIEPSKGQRLIEQTGEAFRDFGSSMALVARDVADVASNTQLVAHVDRGTSRGQITLGKDGVDVGAKTVPMTIVEGRFMGAKLSVKSEIDVTQDGGAGAALTGEAQLGPLKTGVKLSTNEKGAGVTPFAGISKEIPIVGFKVFGLGGGIGLVYKGDRF